MIEHALKARLSDLRSAQDAKSARLAAAREKERKSKLVSGSGAFRHGEGKRPRLGVGKKADTVSNKGDEEFLPEDKDVQEGREGEGMYLSKEVQELMAK